MKKIGEGDSAVVYSIDEDRVVKVFKDVDSDEYEREYNLASYIGKKLEIAPNIYDKVEVEGKRAYEMEYIKGELLVDMIDKNPSKIEKYAILMGKYHRRVHEVEVAREDMADFKEVFRGVFDRAEVYTEEEKEKFKKLVEEMPEDRSLLHGDFMPYNLVVDREKLKVLDWAEPMLGPAITDIARSINFVMDTEDYEESEYSKQSNLFIEKYLEGYGGDIDREVLDKAFIINAGVEVMFAQKMGVDRPYIKYLKEVIDKNMCKR